MDKYSVSLKRISRRETNILYKQGVKELQTRGYRIKAIVSDSRKGLVQYFGEIPMQMCQFHQITIKRRYNKES